MKVKLKNTDARFKAKKDGFHHYLDFSEDPLQYTQYMRVFIKLFGLGTGYKHYCYFPAAKWLWCTKKERIYFKNMKMLTLVQLTLPEKYVR